MTRRGETCLALYDMPQNPTVHIRPATTADAPVIADFNVRMARETEHLTLDPATVSRGVKAVLTDPTKGRYLLASVMARRRLGISDSAAARRVLLALPPEVGD